MTGHCYADRDDFWRYLADAGADAFRSDDQLLLSFLEGASRSVDAFCRRTGNDHPMSGFGPRMGTNLYDGDGGVFLDLDDDLLDLTSVEMATQTGAAYVLWNNGTDFLLRPYDRTPARALVIPAPSNKTIGVGWRVARIIAKWGHDDLRSTLTATVATGGWTDTATTVGVSDASELAMGQTLWCGTEALYVVDLTSTGLTVVRGAHGTTAAAHSQGAVIQRQTYDGNVRLATLQLALRRWRHRETGLSGDSTYGGFGGVPLVGEKARENDLLRAIVGHLAFAGRT